MNSFIFVNNLLKKNREVSEQNLMKMTLKLNLKSNLSRVPFQNRMKIKMFKRFYSM